jgi:hypothetical protein
VVELHRYEALLKTCKSDLDTMFMSLVLIALLGMGGAILCGIYAQRYNRKAKRLERRVHDLERELARR